MSDLNDRLSRDPRRWFSIFEASFPSMEWSKVRAAPADVDFLIENRRTGRVLLLEGKEHDWEPSAHDGQMEALAKLAAPFYVDAFVVRANWPKAKDGKKVFFDPSEALSKMPKHVEIAPIRQWKRGTAGMGPWQKMTYKTFLRWADEWWIGQ